MINNNRFFNIYKQYIIEVKDTIFLGTAILPGIINNSISDRV